MTKIPRTMAAFTGCFTEKLRHKRALLRTSMKQTRVNIDMPCSEISSNGATSGGNNQNASVFCPLFNYSFKFRFVWFGWKCFSLKTSKERHNVWTYIATTYIDFFFVFYLIPWLCELGKYFIHSINKYIVVKKTNNVQFGKAKYMTSLYVIFLQLWGNLGRPLLKLGIKITGSLWMTNYLTATNIIQLHNFLIVMERDRLGKRLFNAIFL